jgi:hypothetical protein
MNSLCNFIINTTQYEYDITYYIKQSKLDLISYNYTDNFEVVEYVCDSIHDYFNNYNYDVIIDYKEPLITFIYKNHKCNITIKNLFDDSLYWVLDITFMKKDI